MAKECTLSTGKLPPGGLPRNSVVRLIDYPDMTSAVYSGCKTTDETKPFALKFTLIPLIIEKIHDLRYLLLV